MSTTEDVKKVSRDRSDSNDRTVEKTSSDTNNVVRRREGKRDFTARNIGRLGFLKQVAEALPGYYIRLFNEDGNGDNPYRIQEMTDISVGYSFVTRTEVPFLMESTNVDFSDSKVKVRVGMNRWAYLLKLAKEDREDDLKAKYKLLHPDIPDSLPHTSISDIVNKMK